MSGEFTDAHGGQQKGYVSAPPAEGKRRAHDWTHDGLMADLAGYLLGPDRMVWQDMQLGPSGSPRPDVFTLQKSYSKPSPAAFEVKVSRSDLRSDTTSGKWQSYLKYAGCVTFAVPDGLCTVVDIPDGCGLIVRKAEVWRYVRRPTLQRVVMPFDACMKLLIDGVSRVSGPSIPHPRPAAIWAENKAVRKKFGEAVALAARDLTAAQNRIDYTKQSADAEFERMQKDVAIKREYLLQQARDAVATYEEAKRDVCSWLNLPADTSVYAVRRAIADARTACDADARVRAAEARMTQARHAIDSAARAIAVEPTALAA